VVSSNMGSTASQLASGRAQRPVKRAAYRSSDGKAANIRTAPMPQEARERLERALCRVLERRNPGLRFAMKGELDTAGKRATSAGDADGLEDRLQDRG
jgi:hypothetical protein